MDIFPFFSKIHQNLGKSYFRDHDFEKLVNRHIPVSLTRFSLEKIKKIFEIHPKGTQKLIVQNQNFGAEPPCQFLQTPSITGISAFFFLFSYLLCFPPHAPKPSLGGGKT